MTMNIKAQIIISIIIIWGIVYIINMVRKKALELRYSLTWLGVGICILILTLFPQIMNKISAIMGIASPMNMLFFLGFCFSLTIIFSLTISVSKMSIQIKDLTQEIALYKKEQNEKMDEKTFADMMAGKNTVNLEKSADSTEQDSAQTAVSVEEAADEAGQDPTV